MFTSKRIKFRHNSKLYSFSIESTVTVLLAFQVLSATSMPSMYERLKDSNDLLDQINKGLNAYLEKKRLFFSRSVNLNNICINQFVQAKSRQFGLVTCTFSY